MKILFLALMFFGFSIFAQESPYTKGLANGYAWTRLINTTNEPKDYKFDYLLAMLEKQKIQKLHGIASKIPINCDDDISKLYDLGKSNDIELLDIVFIMDDFYSKKENLVVPIIGAYCYSLKHIAEYSEEELENYRNELLLFSAENLEQ